MSGFVLHPDAFADLDEIWEFIAADNPAAADRVLAEIRDAIRGFVLFVFAARREQQCDGTTM